MCNNNVMCNLLTLMSVQTCMQSNGENNYIYLNIYIYIYMCVFIYKCICVCVYIYIYIYIIACTVKVNGVQWCLDLSVLQNIFCISRKESHTHNHMRESNCEKEMSFLGELSPFRPVIMCKGNWQYSVLLKCTIMFQRWTCYINFVFPQLI